MATNRSQLQNTLHKPYDRIIFSREVLSQVFGSNFTLNSTLIPASITPNKSESTSIDKVWIYGNILLDDNTEITCYEVLLHPKVHIEQSKVAIQHYVRKLLTAGEAAFINFVTPINPNIWRLTLVAKDSILTEKGVKEKTTNPKRYTFLLGPSETCKTAAERFETLSTEKEITFQKLVDSFSVEKLSKSFFDEYTFHYQNFCNYLQESNFRKSVFNISFPEEATKEIKNKLSKPIRDFVKKLLGRIVFLYFVQKKGWLGASDINYNDGMGDFIKKLFFQSGGNDSFYNNWLTKLFFDTLNNNEREEDKFKMPDGISVKVPFLNGGLFEKDDYDKFILTFKSSLFHNPDYEDTILTEKNIGKSRGFLDFLDSYNFTIYEDSPDDHTVAVDPEMLGHIFENLLEDNKDKGAFYTPKEIVHYMCQESLAEYLCTTLQIHDEVAEREAVNILLKNKIVDDVLRPEILELEKALDQVKICDPAIGSGAFPMGLLQEIFSIKELIAYEIGKEWKPAETKLNIIQNSIYGVDIEKGAVDIARLRFWLSLVVDEEKPKPLPNLDYKIVVGDSLLSKFENEVIEIDWELNEGTQTDLFGNENLQKRKHILKQLTEKQRSYFNPNQKNKKELTLEIRNLKIDVLINQLELMIKTEKVENAPIKNDFKDSRKFLKAQLLYQKSEGWKNNIRKLLQIKERPNAQFNHFDWKLDFPEILNPYLVNGNGGFDIVIANPPYIKEYTNREAFEGFRSSPYYQGKMDIWYGFACKILDFTKSNSGLQCFIAQNNWITSAGASKLRDKVLSETEIKLFTDFGNYKVFETAGIQTMVYLLNKRKPQNEYPVIYSWLKNDKINKTELVHFLNFNIDDNNSEKYIFKLNPYEYKETSITFNSNKSSAVLDKIKSKGNFNLTEREIAQGIVPNPDVVNSRNIKLIDSEKVSIGEGVFVVPIGFFNSLDSKEKKYVKRVFEPSEVDKYRFVTEFENEIIYITKSNYKNDAPNLLKHLRKYRNIMDQRRENQNGRLDYFHLHWPRDEKFFKEGEKVLSVRKCIAPTFIYTEEPAYVMMSFNVIKTSRLDMMYLTALLNSKLIEFWLRNKGKMQGNNFQIDKEPLLEIPIYKTDNVLPFKRFLDYIIFLNSQMFNNSSKQLMPNYFEQIIEGMVYELYFPELIKKHNCEIMEHIGDLPELNEEMDDEQKMQICKTVFDRLNDPNHPVHKNLAKMKEEIREIRIIEGLEK